MKSKEKVSYYHYIVSKDKTNSLRLRYIKQMQYHIPDTCPECGNHSLHYEEDGETYCTKCGLVVMDSYPYVAGFPVKYPYGLKLGWDGFMLHN